MALTLPDEEELDTFSHQDTDKYTEEEKEQAIQQAADLLYLATGADTDPDTEQHRRIVQWGILDMAWKLLVTTENKNESYTPYSTERIGSYSYSKMNSAVDAGVETGVMWFDKAVALLIPDEEAEIFLITEDVFTNGYNPDEPISDWSVDNFW